MPIYARDLFLGSNLVGAFKEVIIPSRFIVTAAPVFQISAWRELKQACSDVRRLRDFQNGSFLIETPLPLVEFTEKLAQADPIFIRHMMPVQVEMRVTGSREKDLPQILASVQDLCTLKSGSTFSVQCRRMGTYYDYRTRDAEIYVGQVFQAKGAQPVFVEPNRDHSRTIISVFLFLNKGYIGCSIAKDNLCGYCDINRLFYGQEPEVSRAEFKLREAIHKFDIPIGQHEVLDLGAAPGGWTKVLADAGAQVTAVDPADLDPVVRDLPNVRHIKSRVDEWCGDQQFDLIVNDMNIVPKETVATMNRLKPFLKPDAYAIATVKLIKDRHPRKLLRRAVAELERGYEVIGVKHLFHNRREVTVLLKHAIE